MGVFTSEVKLSRPVSLFLDSKVCTGYTSGAVCIRLLTKREAGVEEMLVIQNTPMTGQCD